MQPETPESLERDIQSNFLQQLRKLDPDNPEDVVRSGTLVCNLAHIYHETGRVDEAEANYLCALEIYLETLGSAHPFTATVLNNLGSLYCTTGRFTQALDAHNAALKIESKMFGQSDPAIAATLNNLGFVCESRKALGKAEVLYRRAYQMYRDHHGPFDAQTRIAHRNWKRMADRRAAKKMPGRTWMHSWFPSPSAS